MFPFSVLLKSRLSPLGTYSKKQEFFWPTWCQILKKSELFHVPPKIQRASRWNIIFIISNLFYHFVPFVYNNVERSKIRIWIKWTFFRSLAAITFGNILSWSNQDLDLYPAQSAQSTIFNDTPSSWYFIPRFHIQRFLNHTHHKDAQIIKIKILVLIHLIQHFDKRGRVNGPITLDFDPIYFQ